MAMMVSAILLSAVVTLSWALGTYNHQGEAAVALATHGRFAASHIGRDIRAAQAAAVSANGALVLWMGDIDSDGMMDLHEVVVYYKPDADRVARRMSFVNDVAIDLIGPDALSTIISIYDAGMLLIIAEMMGLAPQNDVICRNVDALEFYPNRTTPETLSVEFVISLSRNENIVEASGESIALNVYGSGTMRAPYGEDGFDPQH